jgi:apoptosis-inducing factor 2
LTAQLFTNSLLLFNLVSQFDMPSKQNIVVLGGGVAGANITKLLSSSPLFSSGQHTLTLISQRPFYAHLIAALRPSVTSVGTFDERLQIPYDGVLNGVASLIVGNATAIVEHKGKEGGYVEMEGGERVEWDILVIATGSNWEGPSDLPYTNNEIKDFMASWRNKIEKADNIIVVGGGSVGIGKFPLHNLMTASVLILRTRTCH